MFSSKIYSRYLKKSMSYVKLLKSLNKHVMSFFFLVLKKEKKDEKKEQNKMQKKMRK